MELLKDVPYSVELADQSAHALFGQASEEDMFVWVSDFEGKNIHSLFLANRISKVARGFWGLGLERGDRVALFLPKMPHAISSFYALNLMGAVAVFGDPEASQDEIEHTIDALDCQMVVACDYNRGRVSQAAGRVYPGIPVIVANYGQDQMFPRNALYPLYAKRDTQPLSDSVSVVPWRKFMDVSKKSGVMDVPKVAGRETACIVSRLDSGGAVAFEQYANEEINSVALKVAERAGHSLVDDPFYSDVPMHTFEGLAVGVHAVIANQGYCVIDARDTVEERVSLALRKKCSGLLGTRAFYESLVSSKRFSNVRLAFLKTAFCHGLSEVDRACVDEFLQARGSSACLVPLS